MKFQFSHLVIAALTCAAVGLSPTSLKAQDNAPNLALNTSHYHTAIGLRAGTTSGLTIKQFTGANNAIEGIIGVWSSGVSVTVLWEQYANAFDAAGLNWYYGAGGHVSIQGDNYKHRGWIEQYHNHDHGHQRFGLGIDGIVGLEYKIRPIPFAISLDVKPFAEVDNGGHLWMAVDPGLGIKVTF